MYASYRERLLELIAATQAQDLSTSVKIWTVRQDGKALEAVKVDQSGGASFPGSGDAGRRIYTDGRSARGAGSSRGSGGSRRIHTGPSPSMWLLCSG